MAIPELNGSNDADICLVHSPRIVSANTKTEIRFETKEVTYLCVAKTLLLTCSSGLREMGYLKGTNSPNNQWSFVKVCF